MRAVVIGGSGQIGGWLLRCLADGGHDAVGTYASVPTAGLVQLDASDRPGAADWMQSQRPDVVFYPAGFTWVDGCERDRARAFAANRDEPLNLARAVADTSARFVYFSTDYVFDGTAGPNDESDLPNPLSAYGAAKLAAERDLMNELGDRALVVRTSWVFGPERQGKNFAYQLVRSLKSRTPIVCPIDQVSNPSYGPDVARATVSLVEGNAHGLIHVVGPEVMGRVAFAQAIADAFDLDGTLVEGKMTAEFAQGAPRPLQGGLKTTRLDTLKPGLMRPLRESLADFRVCLGANQGWCDPFGG